MRNIKDCLIGLAYGDSFGMPVETWRGSEIKERLGAVDRLLPGQAGNIISEGFPRGQVTDDTIISMILLDQVLEDGKVDPVKFLQNIERWSNAHKMSEKVIGPSTRKALKLYEEGVPLEQLGLSGETNGASMRISPLGIFFDFHDQQSFCEQVYQACLPTHNTAIAVSGACAIAAAVSYGIHVDDNIENMIRVSLSAAEYARRYGRDLGYPSISARTRFLIAQLQAMQSCDKQAQLLHEIFGTGYQTIETVPTVLAAVWLFKGELLPAVRFATNLGGDTDTISALAGAICGALKGAQGLAEEDLHLLESVNGLDFAEITEKIEKVLSV